MLRSLKIKGYRGFRDYRLGGFTSVNLLVGANNSGKTSILEAIEFLTLSGDPRVLARSANRRGEVNFRDAEERPSRLPDVSHFFFGHRLEPDATFSLEDDEYGPVSVTVVDPDLRPSPFGGAFSDDEGTSNLAFGLKAAGRFGIFSTLNVLADGSMLLRGYPHKLRLPDEQLPRVEFSTIDAPSGRPLALSWDRVLKNRREPEIVDALRILEPELQAILFLPGSARPSGARSSGVLLEFGSDGNRVPLGSCGDGMRRLLEISIALVHTSGGFLLIDEVDTGLHWTAMEPAWRMIVETAKRSSTQVFATTHSKDCLDGLDSMIRARPQLAPEVSVHKIEPTLAEAVRLDAKSIRTAMDQGIEMR